MAKSDDRWNDYFDALKLSDGELIELLSLRRQSARDSIGGAGDSQDYRRIRIHGTLWIPTEIREPSGTSHKLKVYPVDISTSGMSFLIGRFLHQGTECNLILRLPDGETILVSGEAAACVHLQGRVHEVKVAFGKHLDMDLLKPEAAPKVRSDAGDAGVASASSGGYGGAVDPALAGASGYAGSANIAAPGAGGASIDGVSEELRQRLPAIAIELKTLAKRLAEVAEYSGRLGEIGRELHVGSRAG